MVRYLANASVEGLAVIGATRPSESVLADGGVLVAAGHNRAALARLCTRAIWLEEGRVRLDGPFDEVLDAYVGRLEERARAALAAAG